MDNICEYCKSEKSNENKPIYDDEATEQIVIGLDMAKEGERDKCYAYFVNYVKNGIVIEGCKPILDELESLSPWAKHDADAILKRPSKDTQDKINGILFASTKNGDLK